MAKTSHIIAAVVAVVVIIIAVAAGTMYKAPAPVQPTETSTAASAQPYTVYTEYTGATCEAPQMLLSSVHQSVGLKYGLDVQPIGFAGIASYKESLDTGKVSFGAGPTYLLSSIEQGMKMGYTMAYHAGCIDLVVPAGEKGAWYRTAADLKGKTIAVGDFSDSPMYSLIKILEYNGVNSRTDVNIIVVPYADMPATLEKGQIDAFISWEPIPLIARDQGVGRIAINMALDEPYSEWTCCYLTISKTLPDWVATNITKAYTEEMFWVTTHKEEAARLLTENKILLGSYEQVYEELSWFKFYPRSPMIDLSSQIEPLYKAGYVDTTPTRLSEMATWVPEGLSLKELQEAYDWPEVW